MVTVPTARGDHWTVQVNGPGIVTVDGVRFDVPAELALLALTGTKITDLRLEMACRADLVVQAGLPVTAGLVSAPVPAVLTETTVPESLLTFLFGQATFQDRTLIVMSGHASPDLFGVWAQDPEIRLGNPDLGVLTYMLVSDQFVRQVAGQDFRVGRWVYVGELLTANQMLTASQLAEFRDVATDLGRTGFYLSRLVASHPNLSRKHLMELAEHPDPRVRETLTVRQDLPTTVVARLRNDPDRRVAHLSQLCSPVKDPQIPWLRRAGRVRGWWTRPFLRQSRPGERP